MKEHIDEMTKVLVDYTKKNHIMASHVILEDYAERLYNAGYRKQSEGEWKTETENLVYNIKRKYCSNCGKAPHYDKHMHEYLLTDFCPNCGAKMKGGAE